MLKVTSSLVCVARHPRSTSLSRCVASRGAAIRPSLPGGSLRRTSTGWGCLLLSSELGAGKRRVAGVFPPIGFDVVFRAHAGHAIRAHAGHATCPMCSVIGGCAQAVAATPPSSSSPRRRLGDGGSPADAEEHAHVRGVTLARADSTPVMTDLSGTRMDPLDRAPLRQRIVSIVLSAPSQGSSCSAPPPVLLIAW